MKRALERGDGTCTRKNIWCLSDQMFKINEMEIRLLRD